MQKYWIKVTLDLWHLTLELDDLNNILNERISLYSKADLIIDTENTTVKKHIIILKISYLKIDILILCIILHIHGR